MSVLTSDLPQFVRDLIGSPPTAGNGVHKWCYRIARQLHAHRPEQDICCLIKSALIDCGRPVPDREIAEAVRDAKRTAWQPGTGNSYTIAPPQPKWPEADTGLVDTIVRSGPGLYDLWESSPVRLEDGESHAEYIIDALFPGNPLLCCGKPFGKGYQSATRRREVWRGRLSELPLMVPNPMLDITGHTKAEGKLSQHTLEATADRVYQVIEYDFSVIARDGVTPTIWAPFIKAWNADGISVADACAALILHLKTWLMPTLVVVTSSGGKSLHAWFRVFQLDYAKQRAFMEYAVERGADDITWTRSQFVRIPDGWRNTGVRQTAYYFDPRKAVTA